MSEIVQARLRHVFGLRTGALFFFLGGSKGAVLDPPNVLFFAVPELESCWGSAVSEPCLRSCFCSRITYGAGRQSFYTPSIHLSPTLCFYSWFEGAEAPKVLFWTRRTYCFLLCLSSNLAGVLPFRNCALGGVSAAESPTVLDGKASIPHPSISLQLFAFSWFEGAERPI